MNRRTLISWASYDFANTIYSAIVLTAYFPLYLTHLTGSNWQLGAATNGAMILAGIFMPVWGALSDRTGKTKIYLLRATLLCNFFVIPLSFFKEPAALAASFLFSCFFYHASLVFYNSLLVVTAPPEKQAWASGLGTGLGYLGVVFSLPLAQKAAATYGTPSVFILAALLFLFFSIPLFLWVPERKVSSVSVRPERVILSPPQIFGGRRIPILRFFASLRMTLIREWSVVFQTLKEIQSNPKVLFFLSGNFFVVDALNTIILWFLVTARELFHPTQADLIQMMLAVNAAAFLSGLLAGRLTEQIGAMKILILGGGALVATLLGLSLAASFKSYYLVSLMGGAFSIAAIWTAGRKALVELAPKEKIGNYFGLYGLTSKVSVIGSLIFSLVADMAGFQTAIRVILFPASVGLLFFILSSRITPMGSDPRV